MARESISFISFAAIIISCAVPAVVNPEGDNQLTRISGCVCAGHSVTFTCSIVGGGNTIWNGTAFDCPSGNSISNDQIFLRHSAFGTLGEPSGMCNDGAIVGEGVSVENTRYTSRLIVRVNSGIIDKNVSCIYEDAVQARETLVGITTIELTSGDELSRPSSISLVGASSSELMFEWSSVTHNCSALHYNIMMTSPSCGNCPMITNSTTTTCFIQQLQPNEVRLCTFRVQGVLCGNISGPSGEANFSLQVPGVPMIRIVPTYSESERILLSLHVTIMKLAPFLISNEIDGSSLFYNINYTNLTSGESCAFVAIPASSCTNGLCIHEFSISSSLCSPSTALSVIAFASNILGDGEVSKELTFDEINNFIDVSFNTATKRFICTFTNKQDFSEKTCSITLYRDSCKQQQMLIAQANSTDSQITLVLDGLQSDTSIYCYIVAASNETLTLNLTGSIGLRVSPTSSTGAIAVGILVPIAFIAIVLVVLGLAIIGLCYRRKRFSDSTDGESEDLISVEDDRFEKLKVEKDYELRTFIEEAQNKDFQRGAAFYEFTRAEEDIGFKKEVILMDKKTEQLYTGKAACKMIGAPGEGIKKPKHKKYRVFVQSQGIGCRPLKPNSLLLYECNPNHTDTNQSLESKRYPVDSNRFKKLEVTEDDNLQEYIENHCQLKFKPGCVFFEFTEDKEDISEKKEVLLMDKDTGKIFTGPGVLSMIGAPGRYIERPSLDQWRVFIQCMYGARIVRIGSTLLYDSKGLDSDTDNLELEYVDSERLQIFDVEKTCSIGDIVKINKLVPYNPRRFFFEFTRENEEITDDKEIILMEKDTQKLFTGSKAKEMIEAPAKEVKRPTLKKYRVFVQNGGGDTRCLKKGTKLLYERSYQF